MRNRRFGNDRRQDGRSAEKQQTQHASSGLNGGMWRGAILAACNRFEANEEIKRQHGPVRILVKDGKLVEQYSTVSCDPDAVVTIVRDGQSR